MKRLIYALIAALLMGSTSSFAQQATPKENSIYVTGSTGFSSHNLMLGIAKVEYNRQIKGNWFWGTFVQSNFGLGRVFSYDIDPMQEYDPYHNTVRQDIYQVSGMIYYRFPIARKWLSLRTGAGLGVGYHHIHNHIDNDSGLHDKLMPYVNVEVAWIVKLAKHIDLKFAPTIIGVPQSLSYSPMKLGAPTDLTSRIYDAGVNLGLGVRF